MPRIEPLRVCPESALQSLHQSEVGDLEGAIGRKEDIGGFEVAVDHLVLVGNMHCAGKNFDDPGGLVDRLGLAVDLLGEAAAREIFEREIRQAVLLADFEDLDDVGVFDRGDRFRFRVEASEVLGPRAAPARIIFRATNRSSRSWRAL